VAVSSCSDNGYDLRCLAAKATKIRPRPIKLSCAGICSSFSVKWSVPLAISTGIFLMDSTPLFAEGTCSFVYYGLASSFNGPVLVDPPTHVLLLHSLFISTLLANSSWPEESF